VAVAFVALVLVLAVLVVVPVRHVTESRATWFAFSTGLNQGDIVDGVVDTGFNPCPSDDSSGLGQVSILWHTLSGQSIQFLNVLVFEPHNNTIFVVYNDKNSSAGNYAFALTNSNGLLSCAGEYGVVWGNPTPVPTIVTVVTAYNVSETIPLLSQD